MVFPPPCGGSDGGRYLEPISPFPLAAAPIETLCGGFDFYCSGADESVLKKLFEEKNKPRLSGAERLFAETEETTATDNDQQDEQDDDQGKTSVPIVVWSHMTVMVIDRIPSYRIPATAGHETSSSFLLCPCEAGKISYAWLDPAE